MTEEYTMRTPYPGSFQIDDDPLVLVVDDDPTVLALLAIGLCRFGFRVHPAGDGRAAFDVYRDDPTAVAAILLDIQMPNLDGPQLLALLRTINPDVLAYFMTGDPGAYTEYELLSAGARHIFRKPMRIASVAAELRKGLENARLPMSSHDSQLEGAIV
jgi:two-component system response regulator PrrA